MWVQKLIQKCLCFLEQNGACITPNYLNAPGALSVSIAILSHNQGLLSNWQKVEWSRSQVFKQNLREKDRADPAQWRQKTVLNLDILQVSIRNSFEKACTSTPIPVQSSKGIPTQLAHTVSFRASWEFHEGMVFTSVGHRTSTQQLHDYGLFIKKSMYNKGSPPVVQG